MEPSEPPPGVYRTSPVEENATSEYRLRRGYPLPKTWQYRRAGSSEWQEPSGTMSVAGAEDVVVRPVPPERFTARGSDVRDAVTGHLVAMVTSRYHSAQVAAALNSYAEAGLL